MLRVCHCDAFVDLCICVAGGDWAFIDLTQAQVNPHEHNVFCSHFYQGKSLGKSGATLEVVIQISWFMFRFQSYMFMASDSKWAS